MTLSMTFNLMSFSLPINKVQHSEWAVLLC
jgi:hypothetical protein